MEDVKAVTVINNSTKEFKKVALISPDSSYRGEEALLNTLRAHYEETLQHSLALIINRALTKAYFLSECVHFLDFGYD